jgi:hypothetical protein
VGSQLGMFAPGSGGREASTVQARLLARTDDPATSKRAAKKIVHRGDDSSLGEFLNVLLQSGELTCKEAAQRVHLIAGYSADYWNSEFNKRVKSWAVAGHIELTGDERGGGRVWRVR